MRPIRTVPPKDEREYPLVITAEEKDKVLNYILVVANGKRTAKLNYKDIPDLRISKEQYEIVLKEFNNYNMYDIEDIEFDLEPEIYNFIERGGFTVERDLYTINFDVLELQLKRLEKELSPTTAIKVNNVVANAKNVTELVIGLKAIIEMLGT